MKMLTIKNGIVYLDGEEVECVVSYKLSSPGGNGKTARLELVMDVVIDRVEP